MVTKIVDALKHEITYDYDDNGNRIRETRSVTTPAGVMPVVTRWEYDHEDRLLSMTNAEEETTQYRYDANGQQVAMIDPLLRETHYRYDAKVQLVETVYPDSTPETDFDNPRTITVYDRDGQLRAQIDEAGRTTHFVYDAVDRQIQMIFPDSTDTLADLIDVIAPGETAETVDWTQVIYPDGIPAFLDDNPRTQMEYTQDGQIQAQVDERGNRTEFRYDAARQQIEEIFPELSDEPGVQYSNSFDYDLAGKQTRITDALGRTMTSVFDAVGRLAEMVYPDGTKTVSTYDALGLRVSEMDQNGKVKDYDYDPLGRLVAVIQYLDQDSESPTELLTEYEYDELGRLILIRDANQHETSHEYDLVGRGYL